MVENRVMNPMENKTAIILIMSNIAAGKDASIFSEGSAMRKAQMDLEKGIQSGLLTREGVLNGLAGKLCTLLGYVPENYLSRNMFERRKWAANNELDFKNLFALAEDLSKYNTFPQSVYRTIFNAAIEAGCRDRISKEEAVKIIAEYDGDYAKNTAREDPRIENRIPLQLAALGVAIRLAPEERSKNLLWGASAAYAAYMDPSSALTHLTTCAKAVAFAQKASEIKPIDLLFNAIQKRSEVEQCALLEDLIEKNPGSTLKALAECELKKLAAVEKQPPVPDSPHNSRVPNGCTP